MSRMRRICKRCHHVRPVNGAGHCPRCVDLRNKEERRRPPKPKQDEEELAEASTDRAPAQEEPEVLEPVSQATAVEGGSPEAAEAAAETPPSEPSASGVS